MDHDKLAVVMVKLRMIEDCIRRALDQLEEEAPDGASWRYVRSQVERADDFLTDAKCCLLSTSTFAS